MNVRRVLLLLSLCLALLPATACDKATPVAPSGSVLIASANPAQIPLNGQSTITIIGRKPDGQPLNPGTEVRLTTNLGRIEPTIVTIQNGTATATLFGDGRVGVARVTASTGGTTGGSGTPDPNNPNGGNNSSSGVGTTSVDVEIGAVAQTITLQPSPTTVDAGGGRITLLALVRDSRGQPIANQGVNFTTDLGRLASGGAIVQTNGNGQARDTLIIDEDDLAGNVSSITVTAQTAGGEDGELRTATFEIRVQGERPVASFLYEPGDTNLEVFFTNTSEGGEGDLTFSWNFGDGTSSNEQNPEKTYAAAGDYTVRLTVTDENNQSDVATARITVPVDDGGGSSN